MSDFDELPECERELARTLRARLRGQATDLDAATTGRLRAARARAIEAAGGQGAASWRYATGGALVTAAVAGALLLQQPSQAPRSSPGSTSGRETPAASFDAMDILTDDIDSEFYEDLDLYRWLEHDADGTA